MPRDDLATLNHPLVHHAGLLSFLLAAEMESDPWAVVRLASCCRALWVVPGIPLSLYDIPQSDLDHWDRLINSSHFAVHCVRLFLEGVISDLAVLRKNPSILHTLDLSECEARDALGITALAECTKLRVLTLSKYNLPPCPRHNFFSCASLRDVSVCFGSLIDRDLIDLATHARQLQSLNVKGNKGISDVGVDAVATQCVHVHTLMLDYCNGVTDAGVRAVGKMKQLRYLSLNQTTTDVSWLTGCCSLDTLVLNYSICLQEDALKTLVENHSSLRSISLDFGGDCVTDLSVGALARLHSLRQLSLSHCWQITENSLIHGIGAHAMLVSLNLSCCHDAVTDAAVVAICSRNICLEDIDVSCCELLTDIAVAAVAELDALWTLRMHDCHLITDVGIRSLCDGRAPLRTLDISGNNHMTNESADLLAAFATLRALDMSSCPKLTAAALGALRRSLFLSSVDLRFSDIDATAALNRGHGGPRILV